MTERLNNDTPKPQETQALFLFFFFNESFSVCVLAALGLGYRVQSFSSCSEWGQLFRGTRASHCSGFLLQSTGSRVRGLQ